MPRIDVTDRTDTWRWVCPECGDRSWRANNGSFRCYACGATTGSLVDSATGDEYRREEIEFVGGASSWKAPYAARPD